MEASCPVTLEGSQRQEGCAMQQRWRWRALKPHGFDHSSIPPWLPPWTRPTSSHTWTTATLLTGLPNTLIGVSFLSYKSHHVTKLKTHQWLLMTLRITAKPTVWRQGLWGPVHTSLPNPGSHHSHSHHPPCQPCPSPPCAPATLAFLLAILDKPTCSCSSTC